MSLKPIVTVSYAFQYEKVLFETKQLPLQAIVTVTGVTATEVNCYWKPVILPSALFSV